MSIGVLGRLLRQKAVYWEPTATADAFGRPVFEDPVEIPCRWESKAEEFIGPDGDKEVSRAVVFVNQELALKGLLLLAAIEDAEASDFPVDPREAGAYEIRSVSATPTLRTNATVRSVYL